MKKLIYRAYYALPENNLKRLLRKVGLTYFQKWFCNDFIKEIARKNIEKSGIEEGVPYIVIGGTKYYGHKPSKTERAVYRYLPSKVKKVLDIEALKVAMDIVRIARVIDKRAQSYSIKKGDIIVQPGAYLGYYTMHASKKAGPQGKVIAIEALKSNFEILKKNIKANKLKNVEVVNKAVWREKGYIDFFVNSRSDKKQGNSILQIKRSEQKNKVKVEADTLNNIAKKLRRVDFCIIEVNGAEIEVLKGAAKMLKKTRNLEVAAVYKTGREWNYKIVAQMLRGKKFKVKVGYRHNCHRIGTVFARKDE